MRDKVELFKRYGFFVLGIVCNAFGVAFITRSNLGAGPTTCIPYVLSLKFPLTYGTINFIFCFVLLLLQILILRKNFNHRQWLQLPIVLVFSLLLDLAMKLTEHINLDLYIYSILWTVLGCVLRAFGVSCQVLADVVMLSTEAFVKAVSDVTKKEFSVWKLILDAIMSAIAVGLSFLFFGELRAVREGTLISIILIGPISHFFTKKMWFATHYFENEGEFVYETKLQIKDGKRLVVTISSEEGSDGKEIASELGKKLNIPVYDKEIADMIAKRGHFDASFTRRHDEKLYNNALHAIFFENYTFGDRKIDSYRKLFDVQCNVIAELAQNQDCIILGHCAAYILRDMNEAVHIFIYSSDKDDGQKGHKSHIHSSYGEYFKHFTGLDWKDSENYDFTLDSSMFGKEKTCELIEDILKKVYIEKPKVNMRHLLRKKD